MAHAHRGSERTAGLATPEDFMRICVLANSSRYIWNFRINLIKALQDCGHELIAVSPTGAETAQITARGIRHVHLPLAPKGINPVQELATVFRLRGLLARERIDIVLSSTPKGNLYTALANRGTGRAQIANVSGLGSSYLRQDWLSHIVDGLYRLTFRHINYVFFENPTDHAEFLRRLWITSEHAEVIPGLGVDLKHFSLHTLPEVNTKGETRFLMIARLIGDKGVREYVEAARLVRQEHSRACFELLGDSAADNPTSIPAEQLARWKADGDIIHYDHTADVRPFVARTHCVVLPSYREGMSRTLLEGGAMGRPLIASDVPGCREAIEPDVNGFLCEARSAQSLANQMLRFAQMDHAQKIAMGKASRHKIAKEFDEAKVIERYLHVIHRLQQGS